jgi:sarcosine oxidase, subunit gamma
MRRISVSAPEPRAQTRGAGLDLGLCRADIVQLAARRGAAAQLLGSAATRGLALPAFGRASLGPEAVALCVRPERWLLLLAPSAPGAAAALWQDACAPAGVAIELTSALAAFHLSGAAAPELLARGCRLDLDAGAFAPGRAAATIVAQVALTLVALPAGWLLLTPATTARHVHEWLTATAQPFGLRSRADVTVGELAGVATL